MSENAVTPSGAEQELHHHDQGADLERHIDALLNSIREFDEDRVRGHNACRTLRFMARCKDCAVCISRAQGIETVLVVLQESARSGTKASIPVLEECLALLHNLALVADAWEVLVEKEGTRIILQVMQRHQANAKVQEGACRSLQTLVIHDHNNKNDDEKERLIGVLLATLRRHCHEYRVQEMGFRALENWLWRNSRHRLIVLKRNGAGVILAGMRRHAGDLAVQMAGCGVLLRLGMCREGKVAIVKKGGGIPVILAAMEQFPDQPRLLGLACNTLGNLGCHCHKTKVKIVAKGGMNAVIRAIKRHVDDSHLQSLGCGALRNLLLSFRSDGSDSCVKNLGTWVASVIDIPSIFFHRDAMVEQEAAIVDAVDAIVHAMCHHATNASVQRQACAALSNLASTDMPAVEIVVKRGGLARIAAALRLPCDDPALAEEACRGVGNLVMCYSASLIEAGAIPEILSSMRNFLHRRSLQGLACGALADLTLHDRQNRIGSLGGAPLIVAAMRQHPRDTHVQAGGCRVLNHVTLPSDLAMESLADVADTVLSALRSMPHHFSLQEDGLGILWKLAQKEETLVRDAIDLVISVMQYRPVDFGIQSYGCKLLHLWTTTQENCNDLCAQGGVEVLLDVLRQAIWENLPAVVCPDSLSALLNMACHSYFVKCYIRSLDGINVVEQAAKRCRFFEPYERYRKPLVEQLKM